MTEEKKFTHLDDEGRARMVDVSPKNKTARRAVASGKVLMKPETLKALQTEKNPKGDVLGTARIAGVMAAKKTAELIPMCHPLGIDYCDIQFDVTDEGIDIRSEVKVNGPTGVEMEALAAVSVAALTVYDMCKSFDKEMVISDIVLVEKEGGKSGHFKRSGVL